MNDLYKCSNENCTNRETDRYTGIFCDECECDLCKDCGVLHESSETWYCKTCYNKILNGDIKVLGEYVICLA